MKIEDMQIHTEKRLGHNKRITILNTKIDVLTMNETVDLVEKYVETKTPLHLMGVNADKINVMQKNSFLSTIVNSCGIINADGASVVLASRFLHKSLPERVAGIDLMMRLVALSARKKYSVYLLGAKSKIVYSTKAVLKKKLPTLNIVGIHDGYFKKSEWSNVANILEEKKPDFVFVGITSPIKEYLIEYLQNKKHINTVFMGVGGSFDVISGNIKRAPLWMQKGNLEWLFRVSQEPGRLFKRYFVGNNKFIMSILREKYNS